MKRAVLLILFALLSLTACDIEIENLPTRGPVNSEPATITDADLLGLTVNRDRSAPPYSRSLFGRSWSDDADVELGGNGCQTRDDILARDLVDVKKSDRCKVVSGTLAVDPYTDATNIEYVRGQFVTIPGLKGRRSPVEIDHVVALADAWKSGAHDLDPATRLAIANDPLNLLAVYAKGNQQKGASNAANWLPDHNRCDYVKRQIAVKKKYNLSVTPEERYAMGQVLASC